MRAIGMTFSAQNALVSFVNELMNVSSDSCIVFLASFCWNVLSVWCALMSSYNSLRYFFHYSQPKFQFYSICYEWTENIGYDNHRDSSEDFCHSILSQSMNNRFFAQRSAYVMDTKVNVIDNHEQVKTANYFKYTDHQSC